MSLKKCIEATEDLNDTDVELVVEAFNAYSGSMEQNEAAKLAIDDVIETLNMERKEYIQLFNETYPSLIDKALKPKKAKKKAKPAEKLEDVGEKIGGARKDVWSGFRESIDTKTSDEEILRLPLSKLFPEPNYQKLAEQGADPRSLAIIKVIRDEIPAKGQTSWKQSKYLGAVKLFKETSARILESNKFAETFMTKARESTEYNLTEIVDRVDLMVELGFPVNPISLKGVRFQKSHFTLYKGEKNVDKWVVDITAKSRKSLGGMGGTIAATDTREEAVEALKKYLKAEADKPKLKKGATKFEIYRYRSAEGYKRGYIVGKKIGRNYYDMKEGFETGAEAREYLANNQDALEAQLKKYKEIPKHRKDVNDARLGEDYRAGKDVTADEFKDAFGFRGVEFGNWVEQAKRQKDVNEAYDGLMDLAKLLDIPAKAISLNGELGMAFGARGSGGIDPAKAHYEPGKVVINLTKKAGAGSLAHEWFHGLDNYFSRMRGDSQSYITDRPFALTNKSVRQEMLDNFKGIVTAVKATGLPKRAAVLDGKKAKDYWGTTIEMQARTFESYIIGKLKEAGLSNDYLANIVSEEYWAASEALGLESEASYPYVLEEEMQPVTDAYDKLFNTIKTKETAAGTALYSKRPANIDMYGNPLKTGDFVQRDDVAGGKPAKGMTAEALTKLTNNIQINNPGTRGIYFHIRETQAGAFGPNSLEENGIIKGGFYSGTSEIVLVAENIKDINDAMTVIRHEAVGHYGLRQLLNGNGEYDALLERVYEARSGELKANYDWVAKAYPELVTSGDVRKIADEMLAHAAETKTKSNLLTKIYDAIIKLLNKLGLALDTISHKEVAALIRLSEANLRKDIRPQTHRISPAVYRADDVSPEMFYSQLEKHLAEKLPKSGTPKQFKDTIAAFARKGQIKAEELEWSGVNEWLEDQEGKVTKNDVIDFIRANRVNVDEVVKGYQESERSLKQRYEVTFDEEEDGYVVYDENGEIGFDNGGTLLVFGYEEQAWEYLTEKQNDYNEIQNQDTKFSNWQLPGGENYRELLLTLPEKRRDAKKLTYEEAMHQIRFFQNPVELRRKGKLVRLANEGWQLEDAKMDAKRGRGPQFEYYEYIYPSTDQYKDGHYGEANVLAHIRFNERTDVDGKRVLFIEELQSDWHQAGRKQGYASKEKAAEAKKAKKAWRDYRQSIAEKYNLPDPTINRLMDVMTSEEIAELQRLEANDTAAVFEAGFDAEKNVPDAPFKTTWSLLSMKRIIRWAVENSSPGNAAWNQVIKPDSVTKLSDNVFGAEMTAMMPLEAMDGGVLAALKHDKVRGTIISSLPVDVMDILSSAQLTPEQLFRDPAMVKSRLSVDHRGAVSDGVLSASRSVGASLRAKLLMLSPTGGDVNLLPAFNASDLSAREIVGLLSPELIYHDGATGVTDSLSVTKTGAKLTGRPAGVDGKITPAELANLLNSHAVIIGESGNSYQAPSGFDSIAWTTGEQQAARYDLSKQVKEIAAMQSRTEGKYQVVIEGKDGFELDEYRGGGKEMTESEIENLVGKDVAKKLVDGAKERTGKEYDDNEWVTLSGGDLKVGGEGMKGFYDKILPSTVNKYVKKWGGKVGQISFEIEESKYVIDAEDISLSPQVQQEVFVIDRENLDGTNYPFDNIREAEEWIEDQVDEAQLPVHSLEITEKMRTVVMEGQPLFAKQLDLLSPEGVPAETARAQSTDNFNIKYKQVAVSELKTGLDTVANAAEAAHVLAPIRKHAQETMMALILGEGNKVLSVIRHTKGVKDGSNVSPVELAAAIGSTEDAKSVWFAHNHPTGTTIPSNADRVITKKITTALDGSGVSVKGHIIIGQGMEAYELDKYGSMMGDINIKPAARRFSVPVTERMIRKRDMRNAYVISDADTARGYIRNSKTRNGVIMLDTKYAVIGVLTMSPDEMMGLRLNKQVPRLLKTIDETNAAAVIVVSDNKDAAHNLNTYFTQLDHLNMVDSFIHEENRLYSQVEEGEELGKAGAVFFSKAPASNDPGGPNNNAADIINDSPTNGNLGMPEETLRQFISRMMHDSFNRVKTLQKTITDQDGKIKTDSDVYRAEERSSSKIAFRIRKLGKEYMEPMLHLMRKHKISIEVLDEYIMARHAQERNDYIAEINDSMPDGGSGITNKQAKDKLNELSGQRAELEEIAEYIYKVNELNLTNLVDAGHMKQEVADGYRKRWNYYVPLKGKEGEDFGFGTGVGFAISGTGIMSAMGRGEGNVAESPTAHAFAQAETGIVRTEKTKIGQALVELVRDNPDPSFWNISQRTYQVFENVFGEPFEGYEEAPEGLVENIDYHRVMSVTPSERALAKAEGRKPVPKVVYQLDPNYKHRDDVFSVMVKGEELLIQIHDRVLMEQLKRMNTTQLNAVIAGFGKVNRYLAMINTALNPEFVITNFERDFQTAMINLGGEHSGAIAAKVARTIPSAMRGIWQSTFDTKGKSEWRELYDEMQEEGGAIGFFGLEDIDTKVRNIQHKLTDRHGVLGRTKQGMLAVRDIVLDANLSVENAARLGAYKVIKEESMKNGMNAKDAKAKAASVAKNLTVNFNRKGELAPVFNSAYLFFNATMQGSMRIFTALKSKRVRKIVTGVAIMAYFQAMYNQGAGGDDEDGIPHWDKISDYIKQTNMIFMHPNGSGEYTKIRLPYGYNIFHYTGTAMYDLQYGTDSSIAKTAMNMLAAALNAYNPIQGADLLDTITPTFFKPVEQDYRNINFMGANLKPEYPFDTYDRPESQKYFKSTNPQLVEMMRIINEATGGNETHSGLIDISPEIIEHYISWATGGAGMFVTRTMDTAAKFATEEEIEQRGVPFWRTLGGKPGSYYDTDRFYTAIEGVAAVEAQLKIYKGTDRWSEYKADNEEVHKLAFRVKTYKNKIKRLRAQRDKAYLNDDKMLAAEKTEEIRQKMMDFSMKYFDAVEAQE